jgi:hypothetical protein
MPVNRTIYVGVDLIAGKGNPLRVPRSYTYVALDHDLKVQAIGTGGLQEVAAYAGGLAEGCVAINAPRRPNQGLMRQDEVRQQLLPVPKPGSWLNYRVAEYELRMSGQQVLPTPARAEDCSPWMKASFDLYRCLDQAEYQAFPAAGGRRLSFEVHPHAAFTALLGLPPFSRETLEGRLQRQLVLYELGLKIADPMDFFEEVTRFKFLKGNLPVKGIYSLPELDALVAAYTAFLAATNPARVILLGRPEEGQIVLPAQPEN